MKVLVAGDFCPRDRVATAFGREDYTAVLSEVQGLTAKADYSIVNFECPVVVGKAKPLAKQGPNLRCDENGVKAVKYAGFDCVTLANNHFLDYGEKGVKETIATLEANDIDHVGGGMNFDAAAQILYKDIAGKRLAVVNCCEHEFSIATATTAGSNPLNPVQQYYAIKEARKKSDYVLVIVHGGHEHFQLPSPRMVETYRFFVDAGADAVVNHHQHCYSGYEVYHNKPIFYGLGNFCFDNPSFHSGFWTEGYAIIIDFSDALGFSIYPYHQCADEPMVELLDRSAFDIQIQEINSIVSNKIVLQEKINDYYAKVANQYSNIFEPLQNYFYLAAKDHGLVPSLIGKKRKLSATNYVCCEAHRDKLMWWLSH